jgi:hypothetical protein
MSKQEVVEAVAVECCLQTQRKGQTYLGNQN